MTSTPASTIAVNEQEKKAPVPAVKAKKPRKEWPANTNPRRWMGLRGNRLITAITTTGACTRCRRVLCSP
jgi:hypothetical protein